MADESRRYVRDILRTVDRDVEQVTIEPDGKWSLVTNQGTPRKAGASNHHNGHASHNVDDDDDIVEIVNTRLSSLKNEASSSTPNLSLNRAPNGHGPTSTASTTTATPRGASSPGTPSSSRNPMSSKRPASVVIDLTISSDEDEEPIRPPKRHQPASLRGESQSFQMGTANGNRFGGGGSSQNRLQFQLPNRRQSPNGSVDFYRGVALEDGLVDDCEGR